MRGYITYLLRLPLYYLLAFFAMGTLAADDPIRIGSKTFTESYVLGEIAAQLLEAEGFFVERELGLGGTLIAFEALKTGSIDVYPEYTGTLTQAVLKSPELNFKQLNAKLNEQGLHMLVSLGFNNSYAIAIHRDKATAQGIATIGDLRAHADLKAGFSHEFLNRGDGWPALSKTYKLSHTPVGLEHALAYDAIENGKLDFTDAYSTDGELTTRKLTLLEDDREFFPLYNAVLLTRNDLPRSAAIALEQLRGLIDEPTMQRLNHLVSSTNQSPAKVANDFLLEQGLAGNMVRQERTRASRILDNTLVHLRLTGIALVLACLVAIPMALFLSRFDRLSRTLLYITGLIQTIPALALLALLIPIFGLGELPAILALFLYSLLPIVRNTLTGLFNVDPLLKQVATGMGLTGRQRLLRIEFPLAMPTILAGVKTAAIISIGTATLAAFIGAGGLGEPIITGLNLNDNSLILEGAIPAAALAIAAELLFELLERTVIPAHLRQ